MSSLKSAILSGWPVSTNTLRIDITNGLTLQQWESLLRVLKAKRRWRYDVNWNYMQSVHTYMHIAYGRNWTIAVQCISFVDEARRTENLCFGGFFLFAEEIPFEFMVKASRMVKIEKEQISAGSNSSQPFLCFCYVRYVMKYNTLFWTMTLARRKQWRWRPQEMGISRNDKHFRVDVPLKAFIECLHT